MKLKNKITGCELDFVVEGNMQASTTIVFVHDFGTDKNEDGNLFVEFSNALGGKFRIVRFDLSGCGSSSGALEDANLAAWALDLQTVLNHVRYVFKGNESEDGKVMILAHSIGAYVVALLCPTDVQGVIFTNIPNADMREEFMYYEKTIKSRSTSGGIWNPHGISFYPRSNGKLQKIGPSFWQSLEEMEPVESITRLADKVPVTIIHAAHEIIVCGHDMSPYHKINGVVTMGIIGNHNFTLEEDREVLITLMMGALSRDRHPPQVFLKEDEIRSL